MSSSAPRLAALANLRVATAFGLLVAQQVSRVPPFNAIRKVFTDTIPLSSVPTDKSPEDPQVVADSYKYAPKSILHYTLIALSALEVALWSFGFGLQLHSFIEHDTQGKDVLSAAAVAAVWALLLSRNFFRPPIVPPWTNLVVYLWFGCLSVVVLGAATYQEYTQGTLPAWATDRVLLFEALNAALCFGLAVVASSLRLEKPQVLALAPDIAPDDVVTLNQWLTFSWMNPLIMKGASHQLEPEDVPRLSPTQQTKVVFDSFRAIVASNLIWKILKANRFDLLVDISLTFVSTALQYLMPFFLQRIVAGIMEGSPESIGRAYIFGSLGFLSQTIKAVVDVIHLWHGRRANIRVKAGLTAAIYEKALKRKDTAGVIQAKEVETKPGEPEVETKPNAADTGKVVNMMSGDAQRIANMVSFLYMVSSNPFEIVIASYYLYQLLGWSAFVGVAVLVISWPLNSFLSNRSVKIQKAWLKARDKRISIMTELIGAITFIKFFAWTGKWKERAMQAREAELKQMVRSIFNSLAFYILWGLVPVSITLMAFFSFIYFQHGKLTVDVAFTALALFQMLRMPLNFLPTFIVMLLQAKVAVTRISDYLGEEEVPDWVSTLKRPADQPGSFDKVAFKQATLRWNAGEPTPDKNGPANGTTTAGEGEGNNTTSTPPSEAEVFELSDININFPVGKLSVVTGPTGAGKSALLVGLLGEMDVLSGEIFLPKHLTQIDPATGLRNSVAYAAQTPWLQQMSIKDNILFGEQLEEDRYEAVVDACALRTDFDILEDGDDTEIGAKGVSLSGGQKARVALARAVYSYTKHVLLDDPLAAVDSHTAKHLVEQCFNGPLLKNRTVVLVSHHLDLLWRSADYIVRIIDGRIDCQGTPSELKDELAGIVAIEAAVTSKQEPVTAEDATTLEMQEAAADDNAMQKKQDKKKGPGRKLIKDEERAVGRVKFSTYARYFKAATWVTWIFFFTAEFLQQGSGLLERWWLKIWGEAYNTKVHSLFQFAGTHEHLHSEPRHSWIYHSAVQYNANATPDFAVQSVAESIGEQLGQLPSADTHPVYYLSIYAGIACLTIFASVGCSAASKWGSYRAARKLHDELLDSVLRSTIRFFNTTPMGRILNRCTKDIETVDGSLASSLSMVLVCTGSLIAATGMVIYVVPWFAIPAIVIMGLYYSYAVLYLRTGRGLRRLEATSKSPIFSGFAELLDGVISVRAFSAERRFFDAMCKQVDTANAAFYYYWMTNRWLLLRFDVLGALSVYATTILCLSGAVSPGSAGVAITSAQGFVQACYWVSRFIGELEMDFNSVERIEEYLLLPPEPPSTIPGNRPPAYWPSYNNNQDFIRAEELEIKYAPDLPTVFKGSFSIKPREKIGLIGRTGSGKSTVAMSLLRFTDPASGKIFLDGIDITSIGVDDLRSRITYIPQDAVLFSGTIRDNLDPFGEHTDADLIEALSRVRLINPDTAAATTANTPAVSRTASLVAVDQRLAQVAAQDAAIPRTGSSGSLTGGTGTPRVQITLNSEVSAGGANFSQGQRQLVAMARALLRRSNLIIMDEATSSIDFVTDELLQQAIRTEFKSSTVLSIAHRLSSVIDYDRLLVLADGGVAEFDTPMNLLRRDSLFKSLCQKSGKYDELVKAAEKKEQADRSGSDDQSESTLVET